MEKSDIEKKQWYEVPMNTLGNINKKIIYLNKSR